MTLRERAAAFNGSFARWPASHLAVTREADGDVVYGRWLLGNDYQNRTEFYGAFPPGLLSRIMAIFPDAYRADDTTARILHVFSGSLPPGRYWRCDLRQPAEYQCSVYDLPRELLPRHRIEPFRLVIADPPYSKADAARYQTPMIDRRRAVAALAEVTAAAGFLVWLDTCWPMHQKRQWITVGRIAITRSTNHRVRDLTIFERRGLA